jgi:glutaredoxin
VSRRPRVTVYTRAGCHLCTQAEAVVARVARRADVEVVDIDGDPALVARYTVRVPVVAVDGEEVAEFEVDPTALRAALRRARRALRAAQRAAT